MHARNIVRDPCPRHPAQEINLYTRQREFVGRAMIPAEVIREFRNLPELVTLGPRVFKRDAFGSLRYVEIKTVDIEENFYYEDE